MSMAELGTSSPARRHSRRTTWLLGGPLNLVLGVVAVVPVVGTLVGTQAVAYKLGWTPVRVIDPDEYEAVLLFTVLGWLFFLPVVYGLNRLVLRRSTVPGRHYWPVTAVLLVVPYLVLSLRTGPMVW
jgi:hypothetical protein